MQHSGSGISDLVIEQFTINTLKNVNWFGPNSPILQYFKVDEFIKIYKTAEGNNKTRYDVLLRQLCPAYLGSPTYTKGDTKSGYYKACCEMVNYCAIYHRPWFLMLLIGFFTFLITAIATSLIWWCFCIPDRDNDKDTEKTAPKLREKKKRNKSKKTSQMSEIH